MRWGSAGSKLRLEPFTPSMEHTLAYAKLLSDVGELLRELFEAGNHERSSQIIIRMMEAALLSGYDKDGKRVVIRDRLRFDGVGEEYEV